MLIRSLRPALTTCLITSSVATILLAAIATRFSDAKEQEVLAIMAAVLVVFVGSGFNIKQRGLGMSDFSFSSETEDTAWRLSSLVILLLAPVLG